MSSTPSTATLDRITNDGLIAAASATGDPVDDIRVLAEMVRDTCFPCESLRDVTRAAYLLHGHSQVFNSINTYPIAFRWAFVEIQHYGWMMETSGATAVMLCDARRAVVMQDREAERKRRSWYSKLRARVINAWEGFMS